jgi:hypothetical protein
MKTEPPKRKQEKETVWEFLKNLDRNAPSGTSKVWKGKKGSTSQQQPGSAPPIPARKEVPKPVNTNVHYAQSSSMNAGVVPKRDLPKSAPLQSVVEEQKSPSPKLSASSQTKSLSNDAPMTPIKSDALLTGDFGFGSSTLFDSVLGSLSFSSEGDSFMTQSNKPTESSILVRSAESAPTPVKKDVATPLLHERKPSSGLELASMISPRKSSFDTSSARVNIDSARVETVTLAEPNKVGVVIEQHPQPSPITTQSVQLNPQQAVQKMQECEVPEPRQVHVRTELVVPAPLVTEVATQPHSSNLVVQVDGDYNPFHAKTPSQTTPTQSDYNPFRKVTFPGNVNTDVIDSSPNTLEAPPSTAVLPARRPSENIPDQLEEAILSVKAADVLRRVSEKLSITKDAEHSSPTQEHVEFEEKSPVAAVQVSKVLKSVSEIEKPQDSPNRTVARDLVGDVLDRVVKELQEPMEEHDVLDPPRPTAHQDNAKDKPAEPEPFIQKDVLASSTSTSPKDDIDHASALPVVAAPNSKERTKLFNITFLPQNTSDSSTTSSPLSPQDPHVPKRTMKQPDHGPSLKRLRREDTHDLAPEPTKEVISLPARMDTSLNSSRVFSVRSSSQSSVALITMMDGSSFLFQYSCGMATSQSVTYSAIPLSLPLLCKHLAIDPYCKSCTLYNYVLNVCLHFLIVYFMPTTVSNSKLLIRNGDRYQVWDLSTLRYKV